MTKRKSWHHPSSTATYHETARVFQWKKVVFSTKSNHVWNFELWKRKICRHRTIASQKRLCPCRKLKDTWVWVQFQVFETIACISSQKIFLLSYLTFFHMFRNVCYVISCSFTQKIEVWSVLVKRLDWATYRTGVQTSHRNNFAASRLKTPRRFRKENIDIVRKRARPTSWALHRLKNTLLDDAFFWFIYSYCFPRFTVISRDKVVLLQHPNSTLSTTKITEKLKCT